MGVHWWGDPVASDSREEVSTVHSGNIFEKNHFFLRKLWSAGNFYKSLKKYIKLWLKLVTVSLTDSRCVFVFNTKLKYMD